MFECELYGTDCESTGLDPIRCEPIELTLYQLSTDRCRTWCIKPITIDGIQDDALKINGHSRADILHLTSVGREKYRPAPDVLVEIENWLMEDGMPTEARVLLGHNVYFDREMMTSLWNKCGSLETFPLNRKYSIDTMIIEFSTDFASGKFGDGYSLRNLCKKYGVKNDKSHTSESDTKATVAVFREQMKILKSIPKPG